MVQSRRHTLSDWLALHELDPAICSDILHAADQRAVGRSAGQEAFVPGCKTLPLELAWQRTGEALRAFLPEQRQIIDDTMANTVRMVVEPRDGRRRAVTLDNGPAAYPTIVYSYKRGLSDTLVLAHEFAHAVQIRASQGTFVSPIMREVCAFLGESALLSYMQQLHEAHHAIIAQAWRQDNEKYLGSQRKRLEAALLQLDMPYAYFWNYPIARYLAIELLERCSKEWLWSVFEGKRSVRDALQHLAGTMR